MILLLRFHIVVMDLDIFNLWKVLKTSREDRLISIYLEYSLFFFPVSWKITVLEIKSFVSRSSYVYKNMCVYKYKEYTAKKTRHARNHCNILKSGLIVLYWANKKNADEFRIITG